MKRGPVHVTLALVTLVSLAACASAADQYRMKQTDCVARYDTRAEIDACRAAVRADAGLGPAPSATRAP